MNYSEKQLKETTQIAYLSLLEKGQDALESTGQVGPFSVKDIILSCIDQEAARQACIDNGIPPNEITFQKLYKERIRSKITFYVKKDNIIKEYRVIFAIPTYILSVDFEGNKRYFYKKVPKYLDINKILHLLNTDSNNSLLSIDTFPYLQGKFYLNQNSYNFRYIYSDFLF